MTSEFNTQVSKYYKVISQKTILDPIVSPFIFYTLLGISSSCLFKSFKSFSIMRQFQKSINNSIPLVPLIEKNSQRLLTYAQGEVKIWNKIQAKDQLFNISTTNLNYLGLYRKVEVFHNASKYHSYKCSWKDLNHLENIYQIYDSSPIRCNVTTNGEPFLQDQLLTTSLLAQLSEDYSVRQSIDVEHMKQLLKEVELKKQSLLKQNQQKNVNLSELAQNPIEKIVFSDKNIEIKDQYIYVLQEKERLQKGDFRISFHQIKQISEATVMALQENNSFKQLDQLCSDQQIQYFVNGKEYKSYISLFSFISVGQTDYKQLLDAIKSGTKSSMYQQSRNIFLYCTIISLLYLYLEQFKGEQGLFSSDKTERKQLLQQIYDQQRDSQKQTQLSMLKVNQELCYEAFVFSSYHVAVLKAFSCGIFPFLSSFAAFLLVVNSYDYFSRYFVLIKQMKNDLQEIKQENYDKTTKQMKQLFDDTLLKSK